ncbi:MAG: YdeI/OmpD-associated family protein [Bacteroidota bacterium]
MGKFTSVEDYIEQQTKWTTELAFIASILEETELKPSIKWNAPVYTINGKNVVGLGAFKQHYGIWFFNGVFLSDPKNVLINAQEEKTKALRQMRFEAGVKLDKNLIKSYVLEAIENEKLGKRLKPKRSGSSSFEIPTVLDNALDKNQELKSKFEKLSLFKQKEFCEYIESAKRDVTKISRLEKIIPMIEGGIGLNDRYRK